MLLSNKSAQIARRCAASLRQAANSRLSRTQLTEFGVTRIVVNIARDSCVGSETLLDCAALLQQLAQDGGSREKMVAEGAVPTLISLSETGSTEIQAHCSMALSHLSTSSHELTDGTVSALIHMNEAGLNDGEARFEVERPEIIKAREGIKQTIHESAYAIDLSEFPMQKFLANAESGSPPIPAMPELVFEGTDESGQDATEESDEATNGCNTSSDGILNENFNLSKVDPSNRYVKVVFLNGV